MREDDVFQGGLECVESSGQQTIARRQLNAEDKNLPPDHEYRDTTATDRATSFCQQ